MINLVIIYDEFILTNDVLKKIWGNERGIKKLKDLIKFIGDFSLFIKQCYHIVWSVKKIQKVNIKKLQGQKTEE